MSGAAIALIIAAAMIILGVFIVPKINNFQFKKLPPDQKIRIIMKQASGLVYFKNISNGKTGTLIYVKNKRKIYLYPWKLKGGNMICTRKELFKSWDYPGDNPPFTSEERLQAQTELKRYNSKNKVKLLIDYDAE